MAIAYYHIKGTTPADAGSTELPARGGKIEVPAADGAVVVLSKRWWSVKNTGRNSSDAASENRVFFRHGITAPVATMAMDTAAKQASIPIEPFADELLQIKAGDGSNAVTFLAAIAAVVILLRANDAPKYA